MVDRIAEIREALAVMDIHLAGDPESVLTPLVDAARAYVDLLDSDALIIRRVDYEAALAACSEVWPWSRVSMADIEVVVDAALTDLLESPVGDVCDVSGCDQPTVEVIVGEAGVLHLCIVHQADDRTVLEHRPSASSQGVEP